ncbi:SLC5/6 family protein [Tatumella citrea]|uniref:Transporter n=1 Tax=Tatumella citrea TaxID=53336 RepID=A0A1Y0LI49_TATCI|nr:transporter [Tatumella citrea]ARU93713.1 transporter [Tatumella citrea]ARU97751.1 transporter [Tatumella citrea]
MIKCWSKEETLWSFALYGTAVGAGTLFLPIQLGSAGAIVLFLTAILAWPLTYWPHKALCQFILASKSDPHQDGITAAVRQFFGQKVGNLISGLYFIAFFVVILIYAVAITNSLAEQLARHMQVGQGTRMLLSLGVVAALNLIFLTGRKVTIRVMGLLVFPLIAWFLFLSVYLSSHWQPSLLSSGLTYTPTTLHDIWFSIPVMVFAFSHTPIISTFAVAQREKYAGQAMAKCKKIMKVAYLIIAFSVMFFVFSCFMSIPAANVLVAKQQGLTILSALAMMPSSAGWLSVAGIVVAVVAMSKSFLGTYFGVIEGASQLVTSAAQQAGFTPGAKLSRGLSVAIVSAITFIVCCMNPNALSMIYAISGPLIALILFIMPTLSCWLVPALRPYRSVANLLVMIVGILCVSVMFFK